MSAESPPIAAIWGRHPTTKLTRRRQRVRRKVGGRSMIYEVVNATHKSLVGEIRNLKLTDGAGGGCSLNHFFTISKDSLHVAYDYAQSKVIPALQKLFAK